VDGLEFPLEALLLKPLLAVSAILASAAHFIGVKAGRSSLARGGFAALCGVALLSGMSYFEVGARDSTPHYMNVHDVYHYYMGSKYFDELGYYDLYNATLAADAEDERRLEGVRHVRDLLTHRSVEVDVARAARTQWHRNFSAERWAEFKGDLRFFLSVPQRRGIWSEALTDLGFNPPPFWVVMSRPITDLVATGNTVGMYLLLRMDLLYLAIIFGAIGWAFGAVPCLLSIVVFGTNYFVPYHSVGGAMLRFGWLAALVSSLCLLKRGYPIGAGALLGISALLRIFPALYLLGIVLKGLYEFVFHRRRDTVAIRFVSGFVLATLAGASLSAVALDEPVAAWRAFGKNIAMHDQNWTTHRIGLKHVFTWSGETRVEETTPGAWPNHPRAQNQFAARLLPFRLAVIGVLAGVVCLRFVPRRQHWEAMALGSLFVFLTTSPTRYYYSQLILLVPLLLAGSSALGVPGRREFLGFVALILAMVALYVSEALIGFDYYLQFVNCSILLLFFIALVWLMSGTARNRPASIGAPG